MRGKIWENGKVTAGILPCKKIRQADREYEIDYAGQFDTALIPTCDYKGFRVEQETYFIPERSQKIIEQKYLLESDQGIRCSLPDKEDCSLPKQTAKKIEQMCLQRLGKHIRFSSPINSHNESQHGSKKPRAPRGQSGLTAHGKI